MRILRAQLQINLQFIKPFAHTMRIAKYKNNKFINICR